MRSCVNTFTHSHMYASTTREREQPVVNEKCKLMRTAQHAFRQGFTRTSSLRQAQGRFRAEPRDLHPFFGFIGLIRAIRAIRGCKSQEKASTIFTGLCKTKPIFRQGKINVSSVLRKDYEERAHFAGGSKQSQSKPISGRANVKMRKLFWAKRTGAEGT